MKKPAVIVFFIVILGFLIYVAAGPFITIHQIKTGIDEQDSEKLSDNIDFPALRSNLKEQFNAVFIKESVNELEGNPFAALAMGLASQLVNNLVDAFITPSGLAALMAGKKPGVPEDIKEEQSTQKAEVQKTELFKNARYSFDGFSKFSARIKDENEKEIRFVFARDGLSWKLTNIIIPLNNK